MDAGFDAHRSPQNETGRGRRTRGAARAGRGHTRWRRFVLTFAVGGLASLGLLFGLSQGALAASFSVAGSAFKINADRLSGTGLVLYGGEVRSASGGKAVASLGVRKAAIKDFCTSFVVRNLPILGAVSIKLDNPGDLTGDNMLLDVSELGASTLTLKGAQLGKDAGQLTGGPADAQGPAGSTGVQAAELQATGLKGDTWALTAGTVSLNGVTLTARPGTANTCG